MSNNEKYFCHRSSIIDDKVIIGKGSKIWHFSHIQSGAVIGENCSLGQNVNIANNVKIGNHVKIQNNVSVYEGVEIEDFALIMIIGVTIGTYSSILFAPYIMYYLYRGKIEKNV